ncbi:MAG: hypothetical protein PHE02_08990 [Lachnospiraceae bacterium]|nr:hypothetical protein [Lachnospiraceae bacterium]
MNTDYSQFYRGTSSINSYGNGAYKKDTLAKYEFNTTDEDGSKVMDKMSKEETMQTMNHIASQYGDNVIVEFSGDGLAALVESKRGISDQSATDEQVEANGARQTAFEREIVHYDRKANDLPAYSGIYNSDKAIATAVQNGSKEEQGFVYDIIRQNFLVTDSSSMTEEERQANISLGMKKAEYAAENFIPEEQKEKFMKAMRDVASLASAGKRDEFGKMDYGLNKPSYLGHGSNLVYTTNAEDVMKQTDTKAYEEYEKLNDTEDEDKVFNRLKYLTNWYANSVSKNQNLVKDYEEKNDAYIQEKKESQKISTAFEKVDTTSKKTFLESLRKMQENSGLFSTLIQKEMSNAFWLK